MTSDKAQTAIESVLGLTVKLEATLSLSIANRHISDIKLYLSPELQWCLSVVGHERKVMVEAH